MELKIDCAVVTTVHNIMVSWLIIYFWSFARFTGSDIKTLIKRRKVRFRVAVVIINHNLMSRINANVLFVTEKPV